MATFAAGFSPLRATRATLTRCCSRCAAVRSPPPTSSSSSSPRLLLLRHHRPFSSGSGSGSGSGKRPRFSQRLGDALRNTKIQWYQIPVGLGIGFLGLVQFYKVSAREQEKQRELEVGEPGSQPRGRPKVRPDGPWYG